MRQQDAHLLRWFYWLTKSHIAHCNMWWIMCNFWKQFLNKKGGYIYLTACINWCMCMWTAQECRIKDATHSRCTDELRIIFTFGSLKGESWLNWIMRPVKIHTCSVSAKFLHVTCMEAATRKKFGLKHSPDISQRMSSDFSSRLCAMSFLIGATSSPTVFVTQVSACAHKHKPTQT